jgi:hypothetical protein
MMEVNETNPCLSYLNMVLSSLSPAVVCVVSFHRRHELGKSTPSLRIDLLTVTTQSFHRVYLNSASYSSVEFKVSLTSQHNLERYLFSQFSRSKPR